MNDDKRIVPDETDAVILCGGIGKRLKSAVSDRPKPMAEVGGRPFLDILIDYAASFGFRRFILCAGYMGDVINKYYSERKGFPAQAVISQELEPLGTAGAIKNAQPLIKSSPFLVMNGDSLCRLDLLKFIRFHEEKGASFSAALAVSKGGKDYGKVSVDDSGRITGFNEKTEAGKGGLINAGVYLLDRKIFSVIPGGKKISLEYDVFPGMTGDRFYGYITGEEVIDIGTPDRYLAAQRITYKVLYGKK